MDDSSSSCSRSEGDEVFYSLTSEEAQLEDEGEDEEGEYGEEDGEDEDSEFDNDDDGELEDEDDEEDSAENVDIYARKVSKHDPISLEEARLRARKGKAMQRNPTTQGLSRRARRKQNKIMSRTTLQTIQAFGQAVEAFTGDELDSVISTHSSVGETSYQVRSLVDLCISAVSLLNWNELNLPMELMARLVDRKLQAFLRRSVLDLRDYPQINKCLWGCLALMSPYTAPDAYLFRFPQCSLPFRVDILCSNPANVNAKAFLKAIVPADASPETITAATRGIDWSLAVAFFRRGNLLAANNTILRLFREPCPLLCEEEQHLSKFLLLIRSAQFELAYGNCGSGVRLFGLAADYMAGTSLSPWYSSLAHVMCATVLQANKEYGAAWSHHEKVLQSTSEPFDYIFSMSLVEWFILQGKFEEGRAALESVMINPHLNTTFRQSYNCPEFALSLLEICAGNLVGAREAYERETVENFNWAPFMTECAYGTPLPLFTARWRTFFGVPRTSAQSDDGYDLDSGQVVVDGNELVVTGFLSCSSTSSQLGNHFRVNKHTGTWIPMDGTRRPSIGKSKEVVTAVWAHEEDVITIFESQHTRLSYITSYNDNAILYRTHWDTLIKVDLTPLVKKKFIEASRLALMSDGLTKQDANELLVHFENAKYWPTPQSARMAFRKREDYRAQKEKETKGAFQRAMEQKKALQGSSKAPIKGRKHRRATRVEKELEKAQKLAKKKNAPKNMLEAFGLKATYECAIFLVTCQTLGSNVVLVKGTVYTGNERVYFFAVLRPLDEDWCNEEDIYLALNDGDGGTPIDVWTPFEKILIEVAPQWQHAVVAEGYDYLGNHQGYRDSWVFLRDSGERVLIKNFSGLVVVGDYIFGLVCGAAVTLVRFDLTTRTFFSKGIIFETGDRCRAFRHAVKAAGPRHVLICDGNNVRLCNLDLEPLLVMDGPLGFIPALPSSHSCLAYARELMVIGTGFELRLWSESHGLLWIRSLPEGQCKEAIILKDDSVVVALSASLAAEHGSRNGIVIRYSKAGDLVGFWPLLVGSGSLAYESEMDSLYVVDHQAQMYCFAVPPCES